MKKNSLVTKLAALGLSAALGLAGCGGQSGNGGQNSEVSDVAITAEEEALAKELLDRNVTANDVITVGVIESAIAQLKEKYDFEELDDLKIGSGGWVYLSDKYGWFTELLGDNNTKVSIVEGAVGNEVQLMERNLQSTGW